MSDKAYIVEYHGLRQSGSYLQATADLFAANDDQAEALAIQGKLKDTVGIGVYRLIRLVDVAELKRKQPAPKPRQKPKSYKDYLAQRAIPGTRT